MWGSGFGISLPRRGSLLSCERGRGSLRDISSITNSSPAKPRRRSSLPTRLSAPTPRGCFRDDRPCRTPFPSWRVVATNAVGWRFNRRCRLTGPPVSPLRVLCVEDESPIRSLLAEIVRDEGFDVVEAEDVDQAVRLLDAYHFQSAARYRNTQTGGPSGLIRAGSRRRVSAGRVFGCRRGGEGGTERRCTTGAQFQSLSKAAACLFGPRVWTTSALGSSAAKLGVKPEAGRANQ